MAALGDAFFIQTFTTTLQRYEKQLVDNILVSHPLLEIFKSNAKSITGRGLVIPLRTSHLGATVKSDDSGTHSTAVSAKTMGSAVYDWATEIVTPFRLAHRDILQNSGPEQIVNLVEAYVEGATRDHQDYIVSKLYADAEAWTPGDFFSVDALMGDATYDAAVKTAVTTAGYTWLPVGGIDPNSVDADKTFWQATRLTIPAVGSGAKDILTAMRKVQNEIFRHSRKRPTHIVCGFNVYEEFEEYLQDKGRYLPVEGTANTRFTSIKFGDVEIRLDPDAPDSNAYFYHMPSLRFAYCAGEFMKSYPAIPLPGTLDTVVPIASTILFGVAERRANGLLIRTYA